MLANKWWQFWQDNIFPFEGKIKKSLKEIQTISWAKVQYASMLVCADASVVRERLDE